MDIAIPLFDRFTALDAVGPYEVLQRLPNVTVTFIGERTGEFRTENNFLGVVADATFGELPKPDVIVVPGGIGTRQVISEENHPLLQWLQSAHVSTRLTTSVCTGSLMLARAGLLSNLAATTHWSAFELLEKLGAVPCHERIVEHLERRIVTAAGVSAGIDMALRVSELLVDTIAAKAMQVTIEYDPQPPFDAGSVAKAGKEVLERAEEYAKRKD